MVGVEVAGDDRGAGGREGVHGEVIRAVVVLGSSNRRGEGAVDIEEVERRVCTCGALTSVRLARVTRFQKYSGGAPFR